MISDSTNTIISIHAPRVGSDLVEQYPELESKLFQSTLPVWGATRPEWVDKILSGVSIHAPRVGSDWTWATRWLSRMSFNPRSPWGERRITRQYILTINRFQSTLPVGGATT